MFLRNVIKENVHILNAVTHSISWTAGFFGPYHFPNPNYQKSDQDVAIICIHGTADTSSAFRTLARRLVRGLPSNVSGIHLVSFEKRFIHRNGIDVYAKQLCEQILNLKVKNVYLMGHSRGGLIALKYAFDYASRSGVNVIGISPICSPVGGSHLAVDIIKGISKSVEEMMIGSDFLDHLQDQIIATKIPISYAAGENDWIVRPECSYIKENSKSIATYDRHGHLSILSSRRLVQYIHDCIVSAIHDWLMVSKKMVPKDIEDAKNIEGNYHIPTSPSDANDMNFPELLPIFDEINQQIISSRKKKNFVKLREYFSDSELVDLKLLSNYFSDMLCGIRRDNYEANTAGDFLRCFINEKYPNYHSTLQRYSKAVTDFFYKSEPTPDIFFQKLFEKYYDVSIPQRLNLTETVTTTTISTVDVIVERDVESDSPPTMLSR